MAEKYVSVSALRELLSIPSDGDCEKCNHYKYHGCYNDELVRACEAIDDAPEADVRPVVHAEWEQVMGKYDKLFRCSKCHFVPIEPHYFCQNCGADMREDGTDG